jgi:hypothetical protein
MFIVAPETGALRKLVRRAAVLGRSNVRIPTHVKFRTNRKVRPPYRHKRPGAGHDSDSEGLNFFSQVSAQQGGKFSRGKDDNGFAFDGEQFLFAEFREGAGKSFAYGA